MSNLLKKWPKSLRKMAKIENFYFSRGEIYLNKKSYVIRNGVKNWSKPTRGTPQLFSSFELFLRFSDFLGPKIPFFSGLGRLRPFLDNFSPQTGKRTPKNPYFGTFGAKIGFGRRINRTLRVRFTPRLNRAALITCLAFNFVN